MNSRYLVFAGTTEGREITEYIDSLGIPAITFVTTEQGKELIKLSNYTVEINVGALSENEIKNILIANKDATVIDATHPYAEIITSTLCKLTKELDIKYIRLKRNESDTIDKAKYFDDLDSIIDYLENTSGNILVTLGSKEANEFARLSDYKNRVTLRILDNQSMIEKVKTYGYSEDKLIIGMGPFSLDDNKKHLEKCKAMFLVTKDSGDKGGFKEKIAAALSMDVEVLVLKRPVENGYSLEEVKAMI